MFQTFPWLARPLDAVQEADGSGCTGFSFSPRHLHIHHSHSLCCQAQTHLSCGGWGIAIRFKLTGIWLKLTHIGEIPCLLYRTVFLFLSLTDEEQQNHSIWFWSDRSMGHRLFLRAGNPGLLSLCRTRTNIPSLGGSNSQLERVQLRSGQNAVRKVPFYFHVLVQACVCVHL